VKRKGENRVLIVENLLWYDANFGIHCKHTYYSFTRGFHIHNSEWETQARLISESVLVRNYHTLKRDSEFPIKCPKFKNGRN
jgi:hypothetical protein